MEAAALFLGRERKTIHNCLSANRHLFLKRYYRRGQGGRLYRILTLDDFKVLQTHFPILVKEFASVPANDSR